MNIFIFALIWRLEIVRSNSMLCQLPFSQATLEIYKADLCNSHNLDSEQVFSCSVILIENNVDDRFHQRIDVDPVGLLVHRNSRYCDRFSSALKEFTLSSSRFLLTISQFTNFFRIPLNCFVVLCHLHQPPLPLLQL
eukprot:TRINITY_DN4780_c1_g1_i16.p1 TRINITY_DN4780_c1_g1~~TRINITY_DN4780_c1_g1_i16.p1  ORF type:complete len:137 (+),score=24.05 TRINITY_DN4780_c1_g1_i16:1090-1500(+)